VPTKVEAPHGKIFPQSDRARDVLAALQAELAEQGVVVQLNTPIASLATSEDRVVGAVTPTGGTIGADAVIVCVGGLSFPKSGSTGDGYKMARDVGHRVAETFPSLVPLRVAGTADLSGVALRGVEGSVRVDGKTAGPAFRGDVLFTHFGLSGPVILQLSRAASDGLRRGGAAEIRIDLFPGLSVAQLDSRWIERLANAPRAHLSTLLQADLPRSAAGAFLAAAGVPGDRVSSELSRSERLRIVETLRAWRFPVAGWHSMEAAEVTSGGVDVREVDPRTFASRLVRGLYWAGEVLDVDGYVGGFNLQAAWSSGWVAGRAAAAYTRELASSRTSSASSAAKEDR
ncbi:MAG: aminoacetone oxidase family FAD-binding enzyme, partial [Candidatus Sericytochromatia bacterium]|nr:aminoacetone oxidase family FAD-binding enzyme [Candidatus Tanganyikabacteria bacterium]